MSVAAVVIGRNEGARLIACLEALKGKVGQIIYVDSGSTDGSVQAASDRDAQVVSLDMLQPFTAARARNAGVAQVADSTDYVQFLDGDCIIQAGWIDAAQTFLQDRAEVAVVCGRRREIHPQASIYNAMIDAEWDTPVGEAKACGGDALMRMGALRAAGGFRDSLIAGEEPELCVRLRRLGWKIWRLDAEMTAHDADITKFSQWWKRSRRAGHAFAEGAALHGAPPELHWIAETRRAMLWGVVLPILIAMLSLFATSWALLLFAVYPAQVTRLSSRGGWVIAFFTTLGKVPEGLGACQYYARRLTKRDATLIEYKS